jgi:phospholipid/cholesterol/gamma-HCH transport system permease protein
VVGLTAIFTGMVLALQTYSGFQRFNAESAVATVVVISMARELRPVIGGLMVAGRVGASIAAEIGTMRVTDQIDALSTLSTNPFKYLVVPRILAGLITLPILVLVADIIGVFGGFVVGTVKLNFNASSYLHQTFSYLTVNDVASGLIKAGVFGFVVTLMGCYHGYHSRGGAQGVGAATTYAVVSGSILILLVNYLLTSLLFV